MTVLFGEGVSGVFEQLPRAVQLEAAKLIDLLAIHPKMYPVRRRGIMKGYRYFVVHNYLFYYSVSSTEVRIAAVIPGQMMQA